MMRFRSKHVTSEQKGLIWDFALAYEKWVCQGAPNHEPFRVDHGICQNLQHWVEWKGLERHNLPEAVRLTWGQFSCYPFGGAHAYFRETRLRLLHHNSLRWSWIQWVLSGMRHQSAWWESSKDEIKWWDRYAG